MPCRSGDTGPRPSGGSARRSLDAAGGAPLLAINGADDRYVPPGDTGRCSRGTAAPRPAAYPGSEWPE